MLHISFSSPFHPIISTYPPLRPFQTIPTQFDYVHSFSLYSSLGQSGPEPPDNGKDLFLNREKLLFVATEGQFQPESYSR